MNVEDVANRMCKRMIETSSLSAVGVLKTHLALQDQCLREDSADVELLVSSIRKPSLSVVRGGHLVSVSRQEL